MSTAHRHDIKECEACQEIYDNAFEDGRDVGMDQGREELKREIADHL